MRRRPGLANTVTITITVIVGGCLIWLLVWARVLAIRTAEQRTQIDGLVVQYTQLYEEARAKGVQPSAPTPKEVEEDGSPPETRVVVLRGPQGVQGFMGRPGLPGLDSTVPGPEGVAGRDGRDGVDGKDGADSTVAGPPGPTCPEGYTGQTVVVVIHGNPDPGQQTVFACVLNDQGVPD